MVLPQLSNSLLFLLILLSATQFRPSICSDNTTDRLALLAFKTSISDDPSDILSSWTDSLPVCSWRGVYCGGQRHPDRVTSLDLHSMNLEGSISPSITNLTFLRRLYLANNRLHGRIPDDIGSLSRLHFLNISYNALDGNIPATLSHCSQLQQLLLGANQLTGVIPASLSNCSNLDVISLRANKLHGGVPLSLTTFPNLSRLILGTNYLGGRIPPEIGNLTSLSILDLAQNNLVGDIPATIGKIGGLGSLQITINNLTGAIPPSIYNLSSIFHLHVATNQLVGTLPMDIGLAFPKLQFLYMSENYFHGQIPASLANATNLLKVELAANRFSGPVPPDLGVLENLVEVLLAVNQIEDGEHNGWRFLNSLVNCSSLQVLDMYDNKLTGRFPDAVSNLSATLWKLSLNSNQISGSIPEGIGSLVGLTALYLGGNNLTGRIPATIGKLQNLHVMNFTGNRLSGEIPDSVGNLTQLNLLALDQNELVGSIPTSFGNLQHIELLDLASNQLTGTIPKEVVGLSSLSSFMDLSNNFLYGSVPVEVGNLINIALLDVSYNKLSGNIPSSLGACQIMVYLYMAHNNFEGEISQSLSNLKGIEEMDLSSNNLSGSIPEFLQRLQSLKSLNLSFNKFSGEVPMNGIFGKPTAISLQGNDELCGGNTELNLQACSIKKPRRKHKFRTIVIIISSCAAVCLILLASSIYSRYRPSKKRKNTMLVKSSLTDHQYAKISYTELRKATNDFSSDNLIGSGSYGSVYKGVLDDGKVVAVKVLNLEQKGASKSFLAECEAMRNIRHRNLIKIFTACSSLDSKHNDFKALVFEFMPNGSLEDWLHAEERSLSFVQRLKVAIDVASALDYLHRNGQTPIVHCDVKPSNVLLHIDMTACLGDFGLARIISGSAFKGSGESDSLTGIKGTIGYLAPEYGMGKRVSTYGDVYSYGILLLEMFIGKRPTDEIFKNGIDLHKYAEMHFPANVIDIIDPQLRSEMCDGDSNDHSPTSYARVQMQQESLVSLIGLGLLCSKEMPQERIELRDVLNRMDDIQKFIT